MWQVSALIFNVCLPHISDKATNPLNRETDWSSIHAFCDQLNNELEGWDEAAVCLHCIIATIKVYNTHNHLLAVYALCLLIIQFSVF